MPHSAQGARFAKHVDNTTCDGRRLTTVTYLNPGWQPAQGGALRLFPTREASRSRNRSRGRKQAGCLQALLRAACPPRSKVLWRPYQPAAGPDDKP